MAEKEITAVYLAEDSMMPTVLIFEDSLKNMQRFIRGNLEVMYPRYYDDDSILSKYILWVNEEAALEKFQPNIALIPKELKAKNYDAAGIVLGPVLVTNFDEDNGETTSIDKNDILKVIQQLSKIMLHNKYRKTNLEEK